MGELEIAALLCALLAGSETEREHGFANLGGTRKIRVDCETATHVIEVGLDETVSARDSIHQALMASALTGKVPMVVLIDRDGVEGRYEQEMRLVTRRAGIAYARCSEDFIVRWRMTQPYRSHGIYASRDDVPHEAYAASYCDIRTAMDMGSS